MTSRFRKETVSFSLGENRDSPQVVSGPLENASEKGNGWSLWDEALFLVAEELEQGDDEAERSPERPLASLFDPAWE